MKLRSILAASAMALPLAAPAFAQDDPTKACWLYVGPVGDGGWTFQHHQSALATKEHFGDDLEMAYQESVPAGADAERAMTQMAVTGCDIIFATSFGYMDQVNAVAARFPDVKFEHATGYTRAHPNVSTYDARFYEGRAVQGHIAGRMTESNRIGYLASYPIPTVIMGINSYYLHAQKVNPDVELVVTWLYTWFDPAREADAARAMIDQGVDVIAAHTDSTATLAEATREGGGVIGFGQASDMSAFMENEDGSPGPRVTSIVDNWAPYYISRIQAVKDGTWEQQASWTGIPEGQVVIGEMNDRLPDDLKAEVEALVASMAEGEYHPYTGPINWQDGTPWLAEGETASDADLLSMMQFVEGITAEIPN